MSKLYESNGWINFDFIMNLKSNFIFIVGARGIGKTYSGNKYLLEHEIPYMFVRRTERQSTQASNPEISDIAKPLAADGKTFTSSKLSDTVKGLYLEGSDNYFALVTSISTASALRGFNADRVEVIFFDEFIAQPEERPIKEEAAAFLNLYESVNRNRELEGRPPVKVIATANAFNLANPLFIELGLVSAGERMRKKHQEICTLPERGITLIQPLRSPISEVKRGTALYKALGKDSAYAEMALDNHYQDDFAETIKSMDLRQYKIITVCGEMAVYHHKSENHYYITTHISGTPIDRFGTGKADLARFRRSYYHLWLAHLRRSVYFESYLTQTLFDKIFKLT